jgi:hypothetical protein
MLISLTFVKTAMLLKTALFRNVQLLVRAATYRAPTLHQKVYENRILTGESVWNAEQVPPRANAEIC